MSIINGVGLANSIWCNGVPETSGAVRVKDYAASWVSRRSWRLSSLERVTLVLNSQVIPQFGDRELQAVTASDVQAWVWEMSKTLAPSTADSYFRVLVALMRSAAKDNLVDHNPCRAVILPKTQRRPSDRNPLVELEVHAIAVAVPQRFRALVLASAGLGLRQGEACGLTPDRIDFRSRQVTIDRQLVCNHREPPSLAPPTTVASVRTIPLPEVIGEVLAQHIATYEVRSDGLVFTTTDGSALNRRAWNRILRSAAHSVSIDATSHDLRHHAASLLIGSGCSVETVRSFLGHATAAQTLHTYGHLWLNDDDRVRASIDSAYRDTLKAGAPDRRA